jgi:dipeptidyl aminopeptidase/acylaminoacyl peptidase
MSMFAPTQTQRFRAVVAGAGISNWQSYYGENLIDQWMPPFFGPACTTIRRSTRRARRSTSSSRLKTPMLIVVGDRDAECPAPQSFELLACAARARRPTSLVVYPNEGHHFVDPVQRDVLQRA